jgi:hypothetical protein
VVDLDAAFGEQLLDVAVGEAKAQLPADRVGASYSVASCDLRILMDQPTESISLDDGPSRQDDS